MFDLAGFGVSSWNKASMNLSKLAIGVSQDYYPEVLGKLFIINANWFFTSAWGIAKAWVDERTRAKISMLGKDYLKELLKYVDMELIPTYLGGTNTATFLDDYGPWMEYELVDSQEPGAVVGVRRIDDPLGDVFTP